MTGLRRRSPFKNTSRLRLFVTLMVALIVTACGTVEEQTEPIAQNTLTAAEQAAGWRLLFDGETTNGWRRYNGEGFPEMGWEVADGNLIVLASDGEEEGNGGDIVTEDQFGNFELSIEFKLGPVANSGILYRAVEIEGEPIWHGAPEYQVLDDTAYIEMNTMDMNKHLTGDNYDLHSSVETASNPLGEWNHARIIVNGAHVEHWLNGVQTVEYEFWTPDWEELVRASKFADYPEYGRATRGHIGLQDHGHTLRYRNIKLRPIEP